MIAHFMNKILTRGLDKIWEMAADLLISIAEIKCFVSISKESMAKDRKSKCQKTDDRKEKD